ncbi:unnamed protein product [Aureobasidium uvarum]|uniref:YjgF-like protein n=1 Tax=Aureobasidium uvarum TaxID=2773716 RepID=A0A9N8PVZ5_9PEZI|nr:unnamed protein product [Aureobasidium uvarum]
MSSAGTRVFSTGGTRALRWAGATKNDIIAQNPGKNGANVIKAIEKLEAEAERKIFYISGIASVLPDGSIAGIEEGKPPKARTQTKIILSTIDNIIRGASDDKGGVQSLIDAVVYLTEMERDHAGMNEEWNEVFGSRVVAQARATIGVKDLPDPRFVVEIKGVAVVQD